MIQKLKSQLNSALPIAIHYRVNAGNVPKDHWVHDPVTGGGRIIGEACHFIDLMRYLVGHKIISVHAECLGPSAYLSVAMDKASIHLKFEDGSMGTIHYLANGAASFSKERIEVFTAGRILQLDNFRKLYGFGWPGFKKMHLWKQDKGQVACTKAFLSAVAEGLSSPIPIEELFEVAQVTIDVDQQLRQFLHA